MNKTLEQAPHYFEFEKWRMGITTGKHTSVSDLYKYFIENIHNQQSLPSKPVGDVEEMLNKTMFMAGGNTDEQKDYYSLGFKSGYAAAPQKGMKELFNKLKREFEFVGDEKISGITALRLIKPIFDESPSPSEAGDVQELQVAADNHVRGFCQPVYYHSQACHKAAFYSFISGFNYCKSLDEKPLPAPPIQK